MSTQEKEQQHTQSDTITETPEASQMSEPKDDNDEMLPNPFAPSKTFSTKNQSPSQRNHGSKSSCASTTYKYSINILSLMFNSLKAIIICFIRE